MEGAEEEGTGVGGETVIAAIFALFPPRKWRNNGSKRNTFLFAWEMTCFHCFFSFLAAFATNSSFGSNNVSLRAPIVQTEKKRTHFAFPNRVLLFHLYLLRTFPVLFDCLSFSFPFLWIGSTLEKGGEREAMDKQIGKEGGRKKVRKEI